MAKNRVMKAVSLCLMLLLVMSVATSCVFAGDDYLTEEELNSILNSRLDGNITVEGGDNYNIEINTAGQDNISAASKALLSAVSIQCVFEKEYVSGWGPNANVSTKQEAVVGSGVIYKLDKEQGDAYIITNYHVVYDSEATTDNGISESITVMLYGKESQNYAIPAVYVGGSMNYDLAILKVSGSRVLAQSNAAAATFANSNDIAVLDTAIAIGNPEGAGISATVGHVNVDSEYIVMTGADGVSDIELRVVRTDAAVNGGNSGGGLFNHRGELIGIVNAKMATSTVDNIGYAIPSNVAKYISENIIHYCDGTERENVYRCLIGIQVTMLESYSEYNTETGKVYKREIVKVSSVEGGGAAYGRLQAEDIINSITIDGIEYKVDRIYKVVDSMLNARVGSSVSINITRGGIKTDVAIPISADCLSEVK